MPHQPAAGFRQGPGPLRVVVVGSGQEATFRGSEGATELAARCLARRLALPHRRISDPLLPQGQLDQLQALAGGWLASLPLDPGQSLRDGGTWAEALGAWRQPTLLTIRWQQLASGAAASTIALLRQWRVPVVGVLQWGGSWDVEARRRDGLPWLGRLEDAPPAEAEGCAGPLEELLLRRWALLDHPWQPAPGP
jgi:hypothetical protein